MSRGLQRLPSYCMEHSEVVCLILDTEPNHILLRYSIWCASISSMLSYRNVDGVLCHTHVRSNESHQKAGCRNSLGNTCADEEAASRVGTRLLGATLTLFWCNATHPSGS
jgi:hypothetical protein